MGFMIRMANDDEIIAGMLEGYKRSNLRELSLSEKEDIGKRIGMILKDSPNRHSFWSSTRYDPIQIEFLRKMVSEDILEKKVRLIKKDYFKTVIYLDFFTRFVVGDNDILDEMNRRTTELERIDSFLDPNLELCIRCCSLEYMADYGPLANNDRRRNQYMDCTQVFTEYPSLRSIDPMYETVGRLILEQFNIDKVKERLSKVSDVNDLAAMLFIDINLSLYKNEVNESYYGRIENEIVDLIDSEDYLNAAHYSMDVVAKRVSRQPLSAYIATMQPTTY
jgi:hypothetical protein